MDFEMMLSRTTPGIGPFDCWLSYRAKVKLIYKCEVLAFTSVHKPCKGFFTEPEKSW